MNETKLREDLAYAYKFCARLKLDDLTYTHISARQADSENYFIYPFGLLYEEVTPESLLNVYLNGGVISGKESQYNKTGYVIHGNIYKHRSDINAIFHYHTPASVAVSAMKNGLMPISQWALHFYNQVAYMPYDSLALDFEQQGMDFVKALGNKKIMFLENHGVITCGETIQEAFFYAYHLERHAKRNVLLCSRGRN